MKKLYLLLKIFVYTGLFFLIAGAITAFSGYLYYSKDLPKINSLKDYNPYIMSEVFAADGTKIGEFWKQKRIVLAPDEIPRLFKDAMVASEDQRFFEHSGIDYIGIMRAAFEALKSGKFKQGASTITQQVARNFFLTNERTFERKIKEAILAMKIEDRLDKHEILYLYFNQIYLGNRAYGIEAAAQNYFHKSAQDLNLAETALIVALAKGGYHYDPTRNYSAAKKRQEYVLNRMFELGFITEDQKDIAKKRKLTFYKAPSMKAYNNKMAPWFVEEVRRQLVTKYGSQYVYTQGLKIYTTLDLKAQKAADAAIWRGVIEIHKRHGYNGPLKHLKEDEFASFIQKSQRKLFIEDFHENWAPVTSSAEEIANKIVPLKKDKIYKALVTNVTSSSITAQVGNISGKIIKFDYGWARKRNVKTWGRDNRIYLANPTSRFRKGDVIEIKLKDIGSNKRKRYNENTVYFTLEETPKIEGALFSYDPHTGYVKAIVGGKDFSKSEFNRATQAQRQTGSVFKPLLYASALDKGYDPDFVIQDTPIRVPEGPNGFWEPRNAGGGFKGPMSFKNALALSRNVVSAKIILDVGVDYVTALVRKLGISTKILKVYSMSLGSNEMKLSEVVRTFGIFPTGGVLPDYIMVTKVTDRFGTLLEQQEPNPPQNFIEQIKNHAHTGLSVEGIDSERVERNLRDDLWTDAQYWIERDKLTLSPFEKIILYGEHIPKGYVMSPKTAYTMIGLMEGVVQRGTAWRVRRLKRQVAGKTGTTNDNADCWFVGFTPDHVAGVWTGYDSRRNKLGFGEEGGTAAAPIFLYYMQDYLEGTEKKRFKIPPQIESEQIASPIQTGPGQNLEMFSKTYEGGGGADIFMTDI